jgi:hypothetical protein
MIKVNRLLGAALLAAIESVQASATDALVGRPTPPCCCADGYSYANPITWGHYGTRWRRWPTEVYAAAAPGAARPPQLVPGIPAYELPPAEEEERRAPAPTPRAESEIEKQEKLERSTPTTPPLPSSETGPESRSTNEAAPFTVPPAATPRLPSLNTPSTPPVRPLSEGPTSEADPPPSWPYGSPAVAAAPAELPPMQTLPRPLQRPVMPVSANGLDDPPPGPPVRLASFDN